MSTCMSTCTYVYLSVCLPVCVCTCVVVTPFCSTTPFTEQCDCPVCIICSMAEMLASSITGVLTSSVPTSAPGSGDCRISYNNQTIHPSSLQTSHQLIKQKSFHQQMPDQTDAKKILTASFFRELETTRTPSYYVDEDYPAGPEINNLSLNEATDVAQNHPLWRLMSMFGATHS